MENATTVHHWWMRQNFDGRPVMCGPDMAKKLLELNTSNRNIRKHKLDAYVRDMRSGNWPDNGQTISVSNRGVLFDGQHRLMAIIKADVVIPVRIVIVEHSREVKESIDTGASKGMSDFLGMDGHADTHRVAAGIRALYTYAKGRENYLNARDITISEMRRVLEMAPALPESVRESNRCKLAKPFPIGARALLYFGTASHPLHRSFWNKMSGSEPATLDDPELVAIDTVNRMAASKTAVASPIAKANVLVRAWNARVSGTRLSRVVRNPRGNKVGYEIDGFSMKDASDLLGFPW